MAPPRKIFLFSGHMIDAPGRAEPRFPASKEPAVRDAIARALDELGAGPIDLAVSSGACGGDLLFAEAVLDRGVPLEMHLPFDAATFVETSVAHAGGDWTARFDAACARASLHLMPDEHPLADGADPYEQVNVWMLDRASRFGPGRVDFVCLWDGKAGDGPGGTRHLIEAVRSRCGRTHRIDTTRL